MTEIIDSLIRSFSDGAVSTMIGQYSIILKNTKCHLKLTDSLNSMTWTPGLETLVLENPLCESGQGSVLVAHSMSVIAQGQGQKICLWFLLL